MKINNIPIYKAFVQLKENNPQEITSIAFGVKSQGVWDTGYIVPLVNDAGEVSMSIVSRIKGGRIISGVVGSQVINDTTICMRSPFKSLDGLEVYELDIVKGDENYGIVLNGYYGDSRDHYGWHIQYLDGHTEPMSIREYYEVVTDVFGTEECAQFTYTDKMNERMRHSPMTSEGKLIDLAPFRDIAQDYITIRIIPV